MTRTRPEGSKRTVASTVFGNAPPWPQKRARPAAALSARFALAMSNARDGAGSAALALPDDGGVLRSTEAARGAVVRRARQRLRGGRLLTAGAADARSSASRRAARAASSCASCRRVRTSANAGCASAVMRACSGAAGASPGRVDSHTPHARSPTAHAAARTGLTGMRARAAGGALGSAEEAVTGVSPERKAERSVREGFAASASGADRTRLCATATTACGASCAGGGGAAFRNGDGSGVVAEGGS